MVYDVFISYSWADEPFVDWLCKVFSDSGITYFRDTNNFALYDKFDVSIKHHISESRFVVALISQSYLSSYWCMFEALETMQGEDRAQRLLPVVLKYNSADQSLDEDFVFASLGDLAEKSAEFEQRMIRFQAYDLSGKLDKLAFLKANLPKIYAKIQQRLYPEMKLWSEAEVHRATLGLLRWINPAIDPDLVLPSFAVGPAAQEGALTSPVFASIPRILWRSRIGICASRNRPVIVGNDVIVGSGGRDWNIPDEQDGIYCLDATDGALKWFTATPTDANSVTVMKGMAIAGCDDGSAVAVSAVSGKPIWRQRLSGGVTGGPLKLTSRAPGRGSRDTKEDEDRILCITYEGDLCTLSAETGDIRQVSCIGRKVLAQPLLVQVNPGDFYAQRASLAEELLIVGCVDGTVLQVPIYSGSLGEPISQLLQYTMNGSPSAKEEAVQLTAAPIRFGNSLIFPFARQTYDQQPPLVRVDLYTLAPIWFSKSEDPQNSFGNLRATPYVFGENAFFVTAYSRDLTGISLKTGEVVSATRLGPEMFEQWPGVVGVDNSAFVARHDGYVHHVDISSGERRWSLFLGAADRAGFAVTGTQALPEFNDTASWMSPGSSPILATPTLDRGRLYVSTAEGWLYCVEGLGL